MNAQQTVALELSEAETEALEVLKIHRERTFHELKKQGIAPKTIDALLGMGLFEEHACGRFRLRPPSPELQMIAEGANVAVYESGRILCIEQVAFVGEEILAIKRGGRFRRFLIRGGWHIELGRTGLKRIKPADEDDFQLLEAMRHARRMGRYDWELLPVDKLRRIALILDEEDEGSQLHLLDEEEAA